MEKLYASKTFLKMVGGRIHVPLILPPESAPGHKLQKPSRVWYISVNWHH